MEMSSASRFVVTLCPLTSDAAGDALAAEAGAVVLSKPDGGQDQQWRFVPELVIGG